VIKTRFEINDKNNPDRYFWLKNNTGRDFDDVYGCITRSVLVEIPVGFISRKAARSLTIS